MGQLVRIVLESLSFYYRWVLERIEEITGNRIDVVHMVGGGTQNKLLCQFTANATGRKVVTGPVEATAAGNILMQAIATGQVKSLAHGRAIIADSFDLKEYLPAETDIWQKQYCKIEKLFGA